MTRIALVILVVFGTPCWAVDGVSDDELTDQAMHYANDLAQKREQWSAAQAQRDDELQSVAKQVVAQRIAIRRLTAELAAAEKAVKARRQADDNVAAQLDSTLAAAAQLADQLSIYVAELPLSGHVSALANAPGHFVESHSSQQQLAALPAFIGEAEALHRDGVSVRVVNTEIRDADGQRVTADVLSVGHVAYLYTAGDTAGAALRSPADARGYRWAELSGAAASSTRDAVQAIRDGKTGIISVPIDVSQSVRADQHVARRSAAELVRAGGIVMGPLIGVAVVALLLILERFVSLYSQGVGSRRIVRTTLTACDAGEWDTAHSVCTAGRGAVARTLAACLRRREHGQQAMEDAIQEQLLHEVPRLRRFLGGIAVLGAVAPLLGLLGTVTGIIRTFHVITVHGNAHPGMMAGGISEALFTTAAGLVVAIPILLSHAWLNGCVERIVGDAERHAATLLNHLTIASQ